jgi:hypothetical protein
MKHPRRSTINRARREGYAFGLEHPNPHGARAPYSNSRLAGVWWGGVFRGVAESTRSISAVFLALGSSMVDGFMAGIASGITTETST